MDVGGSRTRRTVREREKINHINDIFTVWRCSENNNNRVQPKSQSKNEVNEHKNNFSNENEKVLHPKINLKFLTLEKHKHTL